jgi:hypothetical protein
MLTCFSIQKEIHSNSSTTAAAATVPPFRNLVNRRIRNQVGWAISNHKESRKRRGVMKTQPEIYETSF